MRIKVILLTSAMALFMVALAVHYRSVPTSPPPAPPPMTVDSARNEPRRISPPNAVAAPLPRAQIAPRPVPLPAGRDDRADLAAADHAEYVLERKAQLIDLTTSEDPAALRVILSELNNQDAEIRQAALSAAVEVGTPEVIPALRNQLAWAEDAKEKVAIQEAIDFLELPPADQIKDQAMAVQAGGQPPAADNN